MGSVLEKLAYYDILGYLVPGMVFLDMYWMGKTFYTASRKCEFFR